MWDAFNKLAELNPVETSRYSSSQLINYLRVEIEKNNKVEVDNLKAFYIKLQDTTAKRALREIEQKLLERTQFIHDTKYTLGECNERGSWVGNTATILDKMLADTKKVYDLYNDALKLVEKEDLEGEGRVKGGGNISMTDSGEM